MFGFNEATLSNVQKMYLEALAYNSIVSPIYRRTGDQSDGDYSPSVNATLTKNIYQWGDVNIPSGVTITAKSPGALILCKTMTVGGLLTASGLGAQCPTGSPNYADGAGYVGGGGGAGGGRSDPVAGIKGGAGRTAGGAAVSGGAGGAGTADTANWFDFWKAISGLVGGSGGYGSNVRGGHGGGYLYVICNKLIVPSGGAIRANGTDGINQQTFGNPGGGGGGGGGGAIIIDAYKIDNSGTISVAGGAGGAGYSASGYTGYNGGAGGTGFLRLIERGVG